MRRVSAVIAVLGALLTCYWATSARAQGLDGCEHHVRYGIPSDTEVLLCRLGYALSFNTTRKVANWVAYYLDVERVTGDEDRTNDYRADPDLPADERSDPDDYDEPVYDQGHLAPAESMAWSLQAMSESFLMSNMAPQIGNGFNRGIWKALEWRVRKWTEVRGELYVVTGPIYHPGQIETIGPNHVAVPSHFYKIVFDPVRVEAIAFILPNAYNLTSQLDSFIVSVDDVEDETGLDFLNAIDRAVEDLIEAHVQESQWPR